MSLKKFFDRRVLSLLMIITLYAGVQTAMSQESAKVWEDSSTGLMWTVEDSGSDLNWNQADAYCEELTLEGHTDWRLATLEELEGLYDRNLKKQYKAKGPINLQSANVWSGFAEYPRGFLDAQFRLWRMRASSGGGGGCGAVGRALCTRPSGKK